MHNALFKLTWLKKKKKNAYLKIQKKVLIRHLTKANMGKNSQFSRLMERNRDANNLLVTEI